MTQLNEIDLKEIFSDCSWKNTNPEYRIFNQKRNFVQILWISILSATAAKTFKCMLFDWVL